MEKTNALRLLDRMKIPYEAHTYPCEEFTDGLEVAKLLGLPPHLVCKTLVTVGKSGGHYVFVLPVDEELDRKKAAMLVGEKSLEMLHVKDLLSTTGYIRGGCTALGMKKHFPTVVDESVRDKEIIDYELQLKDLETIESRIQKVQKQAQTGGDKAAKQAYDVLVQYKDALEQGKSARTVTFETKDEQKIAHELFLLTSKPVMYVCNVDEASAVNGNKYVDMVRDAVKDENAQILIVAAKTEADIAELETYEDRQMFLAEVGLEESGVARLIKSAYKLLNLETYFTAGVQEVRAWTYEKGWKAPQCAGVIHTDFEKGFIRAEVIKYDDYIQYGSEAAVKEAGKLGVEGKEYVVQDGDIMHFRFNV